MTETAKIQDNGPSWKQVFQAAGIPTGWSFEAADWSVGKCNDLIKHEDCPLAGSDNPLDMVSETFLRKEPVNEAGIRFHYRWHCPCGATVEVYQDDSVNEDLGNLKGGVTDDRQEAEQPGG